MSAPLPAEQEALARRIAEQVVAFRSPVLTRENAINYSQHNSDSAFDRWCTEFGVKPCSRGRYSRRWLDRAMEREAAKGNNRRRAA